MQFLILAALSAAPAVLAQDFVLYDQRIPFDKLPAKVDTSNGPRGPQVGYNICNSTTENQQSLCQTAFVNSPDDWCLWAPQAPDSVVGNIEGEMVAWCTKKGHGARTIPQGTIVGMSWVQTTNYIQITGNMDQVRINMKAGDGGGEMDPHGADLRGNPMGGMLYSTAFSGGAIQQTPDWTQFTGGDTFCMTVCNPSSPADESRKFCNNLYDRLGCTYNAPGNYPTGLFEQCKGDLKDPVGVFTGADGKVSTFQQPPESLGPISSVPYDPRLPKSSECKDFTSAALFTDAPVASVSGSVSQSSGSSSTSGSLTTSVTRSVPGSTGGASGAGSGAGGGAGSGGASATGSGASASQTSKPNGAEKHVVKASALFAAGLMTLMLL